MFFLCYDECMKRHLPIIVSSIVFIIVFLSSLAFFNAEVRCVDIVGDGYAMGTDPEPVVIGQSCAPWRISFDNTMYDDFATHTVLSLLLALVIALASITIMRAALAEGYSILKRAVIIVMAIVIFITLLLVITGSLSLFTGSTIALYEIQGFVIFLFGLIASELGAFIAVHLFTKTKLSIEGS